MNLVKNQQINEFKEKFYELRKIHIFSSSPTSNDFDKIDFF